jgi:hypothetical protein
LWQGIESTIQNIWAHKDKIGFIALDVKVNKNTSFQTRFQINENKYGREYFFIEKVLTDLM